MAEPRAARAATGGETGRVGVHLSSRKPLVSGQGQTMLSWSQNPSEGSRWCMIRPPDPSPTSCSLFSSWILPSRFFSLLCPLLWFLALICRPHGLHSLALTSQAPCSAIYFSLFFLFVLLSLFFSSVPSTLKPPCAGRPGSSLKAPRWL